MERYAYLGICDRPAGRRLGKDRGDGVGDGLQLGNGLHETDGMKSVRCAVSERRGGGRDGQA